MGKIEWMPLRGIHFHRRERALLLMRYLEDQGYLALLMNRIIHDELIQITVVYYCVLLKDVLLHYELLFFHR
jgi:hypothetical protein